MKKRKAFIPIVLTVMIFCFCRFLLPEIVNDKVEERLKLVEVVCAAKDIEPRTVLAESDIDVILIPSAYLMENTYISKEDVLGKISTHQGFIPKGALFYESSLQDFDSISDGALFDLKEGQVLFALQTDIVSLGANALLEGQVVDVYASLKDENYETVSGPIVEKVRILGIKDHQGLNLTHPDSSGIPYVIQFAVSKQALPVLQKALAEGEISYYVSSDAYRLTDESSVVWDGEIVQLLGFEKEKAIE